MFDADNSTSSESTALDIHSAADAFGSLLGDEGSNESESQEAADDTPEAAAERLAKQEVSGNEEVTEEAAAEQTFTVPIDGKEVTMTAAEIAEHYKNGLRQKAFTQRTMEAAEEKKAAKAAQEAAKAERESYAQKLNRYALTTEAQLQGIAAELTQELLDNDPIAYLSKQRTLQDGQVKLQQAQTELGQLSQTQQQEQQEAEKAYYAEQQEKLFAKRPEWKDPAKLTADATAIKNYLGTQEFAENERHFPDYRLILLAEKAMKFDAMMDKARATVGKVAKLPAKVERSGAPDSGNDRRTESLKRLGKSGSIDDAANAFAALG